MGLVAVWPGHPSLKALRAILVYSQDWGVGLRVHCGSLNVGDATYNLKNYVPECTQTSLGSICRHTSHSLKPLLWEPNTVFCSWQWSMAKSQVTDWRSCWITFKSNSRSDYEGMGLVCFTLLSIHLQEFILNNTDEMISFFSLRLFSGFSLEWTQSSCQCWPAVGFLPTTKQVPSCHPGLSANVRSSEKLSLLPHLF